MTRELLLAMDARLANRDKRAGIGNYAREAARALIPLCAAQQVRLRLYLDGPPRPGFPEPGDGVEIRILPSARFWTQRVLARELRRHAPDVFFSPTLQAPICCTCPMVLTVHDLAYYAFPEQFTWQRLALARLQSRFAARRARMLMADSQATADDIQRYLQVSASRIVVAPLAPAPCYYAPVPESLIAEARAAYSLAHPYVLYVGRIQPRKNLVRLIAAFEEAVALRPDCPHHLLFAGGTGWLYDDIYRRAQESPVKERIRFLGHVPDELLPALMRGADALALMSLWEGFGLPVVEAMALGTPVLTSNNSSLVEAAGDAALLAAPEDIPAMASALCRLMTEPALREELRTKGCVRAACFSWERTAQQILHAARAAAERKTSE